MLKIGVIFGGESVEHEVSIITAVQAMNYFNEAKYEIVPIYIAKNKNWYTGNFLRKIENYKSLNKVMEKSTEIILTKENNYFVLLKKKSLLKRIVNTIDVAFPIVHGKGVEDGSLAGYLETLGIPYVGPSMLGASIGQDKVIQKQIFQIEKIPVVDFYWFYDFEYFQNEQNVLKNIKKLSYPVIIKPAKLGSSIGINVAKNAKEAKKCILETLNYDNKIIVEKLLTNPLEFHCAVLGNPENMECSLIGEFTTDNDFLTFQDKYLTECSKKSSSNNKVNNSFIIPAPISKSLENKIYLYAKMAFRLLNLKGVTRFDFLVDKENETVYLNEPNTIPGSLAFFFFTPLGKKYSELLEDLITLTIREYKNTKKKITSFDSNVLSTFDNSKLK